MGLFGIILGSIVVLVIVWNVFYSIRERNKDYNIQFTKPERQQLFALMDEWKGDDNEEIINHIEGELSLFSLKVKLDEEELDFLQEMLEMELISREDDMNYAYEESFDTEYAVEIIESLANKVDRAISNVYSAESNATM